MNYNHPEVAAGAAIPGNNEYQAHPLQGGYLGNVSPNNAPNGNLANANILHGYQAQHAMENNPVLYQYNNHQNVLQGGQANGINYLQNGYLGHPNVLRMAIAHPPPPPLPPSPPPPQQQQQHIHHLHVNQPQPKPNLPHVVESQNGLYIQQRLSFALNIPGVIVFGMLFADQACEYLILIPKNWFKIIYKLNASSLLLEGCLFNIRGEKVKLEVNDTPEYCLFPGQVIVIEGKNPDGKRIVAEKIYTDAKPQMYPDFDSVKYSQKPLQIVVASGPFMLSNGSYKPLFDLKQYVIDNQPHVLILIGPFIDAHNPNILQFGGNHCFTRFYEDLITKYVADFAENTQVIVVSSWKDSTLHTVYPTPPIQIPPLPTSSKNKSLKIVPDPSILDISGFHLGVTSSDILLHLSPEELCHSNTSQNVPRLCRIASHLLKQKSFYPLKPSHDDMSIDVKLLANHAFIPKKPHVLVLPSNLKSFINVADDCVIINPERIAKGEYGGSFARIQVKSATEGEKWSPATHISAQVVKI